MRLVHERVVGRLALEPLLPALVRHRSLYGAHAGLHSRLRQQRIDDAGIALRVTKFLALNPLSRAPVDGVPLRRGTSCD